MSAITYARRKWTNTVMLGLCAASAFMAIGVLALILGYVMVNGISYINFDFFTQLPKPVGESGGGVSNAIAGSLLTVGLAAADGYPVRHRRRRVRGGDGGPEAGGQSFASPPTS